MKNKALKDMICNPKLEEFAYMLTNRLNVKGTPQSIDRRVFLKLVAFGLIAYESVGFIDADLEIEKAGRTGGERCGKQAVQTLRWCCDPPASWN